MVVLSSSWPSRKDIQKNSVFRIRFILMHGSASGITDLGPVLDPGPVWIRIRPKIEQIPIFCLLILFCIRFKTNNNVLLLFWFWAYYSRILNKISDFFKKKLYFYNFGWFVCEFIRTFFGTRIQINVSWSGSGSGPMIRIRIRIRNTAKNTNKKM